MISFDCTTRKKGFPSKVVAEEALVQYRAGANFRENSGPLNVYACDFCNQWHFTSKGSVSEILKDQKVQERIEREGNARFWEGQWKSRR